MIKEKSWHYKRTCKFCGRVWYSTHCPHDGVQGRCPDCNKRPTVVEIDGFCDCEFDEYDDNEEQHTIMAWVKKRIKPFYYWWNRKD
jgi:hypothetical protein